MVREQDPFKLDNPWSRIAWASTAVVVVVCFLFGFIVLGRFQQDGPALGTWAAFCRAVGLTGDSGAAGEPQPPQRTPTRIAWTQATLARVASGSEQHGAIVALNCTACHGERGVSASTLIPRSTSGGAYAPRMALRADLPVRRRRLTPEPRRTLPAGSAPRAAA